MRQMPYRHGRSSYPTSMLFLAGCVYLPTLAGATDTPPIGGPGGIPFRAECPKGSYLVGLAGRTGAWVDQIAPICAPWLSDKGVFGATSIGQPHGASRGGKPRQSSCLGSGINHRVLQAWIVTTLRSDNRFIESIKGHCISAVPPAATATVYFGPLPSEPDPLSSGARFSADYGPQSCPAGEFAVGFYGRAGQFVDAVGLVCGPLTTTRPGTATLSQSKNLSSAFPTAPTINSPTRNGYLVKGKSVFQITPSPYLTGTHANYQLRWLNPPAAVRQKDGDFYNQEVPMVLIGSPSGLPVPQTLLAPGTWEIRARINQPKAGDWSDWVRFEYMLQDPIRQTVPQALSPGIGTTLIRPRGVEEKSGGQSTETVEKKP